MAVLDYFHDHDFSTLFDFLIVGCGGALGAMCRFSVRHMHVFDNNPYYYTVGINLSGCFLIGILGALFLYYKLNPVWTYFCIVGFLGGYTTYSAFTLDAMELIQKEMWIEVAKYVGITFIGGFALCALGLFGTNKILKMIGG